MQQNSSFLIRLKKEDLERLFFNLSVAGTHTVISTSGHEYPVTLYVTDHDGPTMDFIEPDTPETVESAIEEELNTGDLEGPEEDDGPEPDDEPEEADEPDEPEEAEDEEEDEEAEPEPEDEDEEADEDDESDEDEGEDAEEDAEGEGDLSEMSIDDLRDAMQDAALAGERSKVDRYRREIAARAQG